MKAMASLVSGMVSIDRSYLDTLIRRAQLNSEDDLTLSHPTITITRIEYDTLVKTAREFANLRRNLLRGGVTDETLAVLTSDESNWHEDSNQQAPTRNSGAPQTITRYSDGQTNQTTVSAARELQGLYHVGKSIVQQSKQDWADDEPATPEISKPTASLIEVGHGFPQRQESQFPSRPRLERIATRTILISNLAEGTAHADVTAVVRGGQLLDIFIRGHDRAAQVSFLHAADAKEFLEHSRRHDLYIKHKRVDVRWSDRQFILSSHVAGKIGIGATRNLVIRRYDPRLTDENIRNDLEHIHNLIIIQIDFRGGSCYISTNSVHNAMFARTCMMSQLKYKGSKIEWDADECAQPLENTQTRRVQPQGPPFKSSINPMANRFQLLNLDGNEEEEDNVPQEFRARASLDIMV